MNGGFTARCDIEKRFNCYSELTMDLHPEKKHDSLDSMSFIVFFFSFNGVVRFEFLSQGQIVKLEKCKGVLQWLRGKIARLKL